MITKKWVCTVYGYVHGEENPPEKYLQCGVPASGSKEREAGKMVWACEHEVGVAQGSPEDVMMDLGANFEGGCSEVGMYLAMSRVVHREEYPGIGLYWEKAAFKGTKHAAEFAELLGEAVASSIKKNLEMRVAAEGDAIAGKFDLTKRAKALDLDTIHDMVHEIAKDEARHGKIFTGLLERYFS